ncbi:Cu(I)/Ag(I) efflux system membrane fusion protein [Alteromonas sp. I10]|uniref:efflux RND transporter periplasmic adaptor subunit n=1 Tax=Alteromonas TaxID=226 RepID=UPI000D76889C|nr:MULTISPECIES: efflux RND transporter periplasmic adaptor subunit [Alteromonas]PXW75611.1 Cu(I)/Ag(I) efflux system membrane fusion protein [Alteromonas sp. I10]
MTSSTHPAPDTKSTLIKGLLVGLLFGGLIAFGLASLLLSDSSKHGNSESAHSGVSAHSDKSAHSDETDNKAPLYWVAPMDDSYRRDKPGKSPMGMDLVPVYANDDVTSAKSNERTPGTVMIPPNVQHNIGVKVAPVTIGALQQTVTAVGNVAYDEDSIVHIHPRVSGWVDRLFIKSQGEQVEKEQALYTLYSPELVSAQEEYVLALKRGDARLIDGAAERLRTLGLSKSVIEALQKTRRVTQTVTFNAPQSGVVEALNIREGFYVQPGTTLMSIAQLDTVWVIAEVPEKYAQIIAPHNSAVVTLDEMDHAKWESHVEYIYPSLSETTRTLKVRIPLNNNNHMLKPNMFTHVGIKPTQRKAALLVPRSAVIRTAEGAKVVLSDGDGNFKSVRVTLGQSDSTHFEVVEGLLPEDDVVVSAQFLIDSESSKSSDFERMKAPDHQATTTGTIEAIELPADTETNGAANNAKLVIARGPIEKWGRGPATMSFAVSKHIDLSQFSEGDNIMFTFVTGEEFTVIDMRKRSENAVDKGMVHDSGHSNHKHDAGNLKGDENQSDAHKSAEQKSINHKEHMHHD